MNTPSPKKLATLVFQLRNRTQRLGMIEKIAQTYSQELADEVKALVVEMFEEGREYSDYGKCDPLFPVSILAWDLRKQSF